MNNGENIFGCFVSITEPFPNVPEKVKELASSKGVIFRNYIWGEVGFCDYLKELKHENYGRDLKLILFQFYVNPMKIEEDALTQIMQ